MMPKIEASHNQKLESRELQMEMEYKIDLPPDSDPDQTIQALDNFFAENGIKVMKKSDRTRRFSYFDTQNLDVKNNGWTLRCVSGFDPEKGDGKGKMRYDYKVGEIGTANRKEGKSWQNEELAVAAIIEIFGLGKVLAAEKMDVAAAADTRHLKRTVEIDGTTIEFSLDVFDVDNGDRFQELEMEFVKGDISLLETIKEKIREVFPADRYPELKIQKYERVLQAKNN